MRADRSFGKTSIILSFLNLVYIFIVIILAVGAISEGTGDAFDTSPILALFILCKSFIVFFIGVAYCIKGIIKKTVKLTSLCWSVYGIIILFVYTYIVYNTTYPAEPNLWGYNELKVDLVILNIDLFVVLVYSVVSSTIALINKQRKAYVTFPLNILLLTLSIYAFFNGATGMFYTSRF